MKLPQSAYILRISTEWFGIDICEAVLTTMHEGAEIMSSHVADDEKEIVATLLWYGEDAGPLIHFDV